MKRLITTSVLVLAVLFSSVYAVNSKIDKKDPRYAQYEANLLKGLSSTNEGLKFSSAYLLGEIESENAVDHLVNMLRSHDDENFRIMAALSLTKIGTQRALFMVKRVGKFTNSEKVAQFCETFYQAKTYPIPEQDRMLVSSLIK